MALQYRVRRQYLFRLWMLREYLIERRSFLVRWFSLERPSVKKDSYEDQFVRDFIALFLDEQAVTDVEITLQKASIAEQKKVIDAAYVGASMTPEERTEIGKLHTERRRREGRYMELQRRRARLEIPPEEVLRMQYREIIAIPRLRSVAIVGRRLEYYTDALYGKDHKSVWRRIGHFKISFELADPHISSFRWINLDGTRVGPRINQPVFTDIYHGPPNIVERTDKSGAVECPGDDAKVFIKDATSDRDFTTLVAFSIRYPECPGSGSAIEMWPEVLTTEVPEWYIREAL